MKKPTKALLIVSTFAVALNLNACVYGPPVETTESEEAIETSVVDVDSSLGEETVVVDLPSD